MIIFKSAKQNLKNGRTQCSRLKMKKPLHTCLIWIIIVFAVPVIVWSTFVKIFTLPKIEDTLNMTISLSKSDKLIKLQRFHRQDLEKQETAILNIRLLFQLGSIAGIIFSLLMLLRTKILILAISGNYLL